MQKTGLILPYRRMTPKFGKDVFVAPTATIIGDVEIGDGSGIWFQCTARGDINHIRIGKRVNIQDGTVIHVDSGQFPAIIGDDVTVGHMALIHACTIEDGAFVGMHSTVMDGTVVEKGALVAAGSLLPPGKRVPAGEVWAGRPAKFLRRVGEKDLAMMKRIAPGYVELAKSYLVEGIGVVQET